MESPQTRRNGGGQISSIHSATKQSNGDSRASFTSKVTSEPLHRKIMSPMNYLKRLLPTKLSRSQIRRKDVSCGVVHQKVTPLSFRKRKRNVPFEVDHQRTILEHNDTRLQLRAKNQNTKSNDDIADLMGKLKIEDSSEIDEKQTKAMSAEMGLKEEKILALERQLLEWQGENKSLRGEMGIMKKKIEELENTKALLDEEIFHMKVGTGTWNPEKPSSSCKAIFRSLNSKVSLWAKEFAVREKNPWDKLTQSDLVQFQAKLHPSVLQMTNGQLPLGLDTDRSPGLLLNAVAARELYSQIITQPFVFDHKGILPYVYRNFTSRDIEKGCIWRTETLRLLFPQINPVDQFPQALRASSQVMYQKTRDAAAEIASALLETPISCLIDPSRKSACRERLIAIFQEAASMTYFMTDVPRLIECPDLQQMKNPTFDSADKTMKAHSLLHYNDHKDGLKGRPITVLVSPRVEFSGDYAKDYDLKSVICPAVVWFKNGE